MELLIRLALGGFQHSSLFRCRRSIGVRARSIHLAAGSGGHHPPHSPATAAAVDEDQRWILLDCRDFRRSNSTQVAGAETVAESRTSLGQHVRVSFGLAPPPASSFLRYDCPDTGRDDGKRTKEEEDDYINVVAAHGGSVLLRMMRRRRNDATPMGADHFVYSAGDAGAGRPPSLSLLPPRSIPTRHEEGMATERDPHCRPLMYHDTGVLRRGGELMVVQLEVMPSYSERRGMADLCVLRHDGDGTGTSQWELKRSLPIVHDQGGKGDEELDAWQSSSVIPVGDRYLCWVQDGGGFIVCDMAAAVNPKLRYLPTPDFPYDPRYYTYTDDLDPLHNSNSMGAAGHGAVRFVAVEPRCCCGGFGRSSCRRSRYAFTVTTWTLTLSIDEPVEWVKDGVLDCEELWALPGYEGIPRVHLQQPVVSLENPGVVCFKVAREGDRKAWMIQVDVRRKKLLSAVKCITNQWKTYYYLPAKLW